MSSSFGSGNNNVNLSPHAGMNIPVTSSSSSDGGGGMSMGSSLGSGSGGRMVAAAVGNAGKASSSSTAVAQRPPAGTPSSSTDPTGLRATMLRHQFVIQSNAAQVRVPLGRILRVVYDSLSVLYVSPSSGGGDGEEQNHAFVAFDLLLNNVLKSLWSDIVARTEMWVDSGDPEVDLKANSSLSRAYADLQEKLRKRDKEMEEMRQVARSHKMRIESLGRMVDDLRSSILKEVIFFKEQAYRLSHMRAAKFDASILSFFQWRLRALFESAEAFEEQLPLSEETRKSRNTLLFHEFDESSPFDKMFVAIFKNHQGKKGIPPELDNVDGLLKELRDHREQFLEKQLQQIMKSKSCQTDAHLIKSLQRVPTINMGMITDTFVAARSSGGSGIKGSSNNGRKGAGNFGRDGDVVDDDDDDGLDFHPFSPRTPDSGANSYRNNALSRGSESGGGLSRTDSVLFRMSEKRRRNVRHVAIQFEQLPDAAAAAPAPTPAEIAAAARVELEATHLKERLARPAMEVQTLITAPPHAAPEREGAGRRRNRTGNGAADWLLGDASSADASADGLSRGATGGSGETVGDPPDFFEDERGASAASGGGMLQLQLQQGDFLEENLLDINYAKKLQKSFAQEKRKMEVRVEELVKIVDSQKRHYAELHAKYLTLLRQLNNHDDPSGGDPTVSDPFLHISAMSLNQRGSAFGSVDHGSDDEEKQRLAAELQLLREKHLSILNRQNNLLETMKGELDDAKRKLEVTTNSFPMIAKEYGELEDRLVGLSSRLRFMREEGQKTPINKAGPGAIATKNGSRGGEYVVMTSIEGAEALWQHPDVMFAAMKVHNKVVRRLVRKTRGLEYAVDGDGFTVMFPTAQDAAAFALEMQLLLIAEQNWPPALMDSGCKTEYGPNAGEILFRGLRVRAALGKIDSKISHFQTVGLQQMEKLCAIAHGGQILVGEALFTDLQPDLPRLNAVFSEVSLPEDGATPRIPLYQLLPRALAARIFPQLRPLVSGFAMRVTEGSLLSQYQTLSDNFSGMKVQLLQLGFNLDAVPRFAKGSSQQQAASSDVSAQQQSEKAAEIEDQMNVISQRLLMAHETKSSVSNAASPPTGSNITLAFFDVEGSTPIWDKHTSLMYSSLQLHNRILRGLLQEEMGYETKSEGDGFFLAFQHPVNALRFCFRFQMALMEADWSKELLELPQCKPIRTETDKLLFRGLRVRCGLHLCDPICAPDPVTGRMDFLGHGVNAASRIASAANGGQIIVSQDFHRAVEPLLQSHALMEFEAEVRDLGKHSFKGIESSTRIYQIMPRRLADRPFAALKTSQQTKLPVTNSDLMSQFSTLAKELEHTRSSSTAGGGKSPMSALMPALMPLGSRSSRPDPNLLGLDAADESDDYSESDSGDNDSSDGRSDSSARWSTISNHGVEVAVAQDVQKASMAVRRQSSQQLLRSQDHSSRLEGQSSSMSPSDPGTGMQQMDAWDVDNEDLDARDPVMPAFEEAPVSWADMLERQQHAELSGGQNAATAAGMMLPDAPGDSSGGATSLTLTAPSPHRGPAAPDDADLASGVLLASTTASRVVRRSWDRAVQVNFTGLYHVVDPSGVAALRLQRRDSDALIEWDHGGGVPGAADGGAVHDGDDDDPISGRRSRSQLHSSQGARGSSLSTPQHRASPHHRREGSSAGDPSLLLLASAAETASRPGSRGSAAQSSASEKQQPTSSSTGAFDNWIDVGGDDACENGAGGDDSNESIRNRTGGSIGGAGCDSRQSGTFVGRTPVVASAGGSRAPRAADGRPPANSGGNALDQEEHGEDGSAVVAESFRLLNAMVSRLVKAYNLAIMSLLLQQRMSRAPGKDGVRNEELKERVESLRRELVLTRRLVPGYMQQMPSMVGLMGSHGAVASASDVGLADGAVATSSSAPEDFVKSLDDVLSTVKESLTSWRTVGFLGDGLDPAVSHTLEQATADLFEAFESLPIGAMLKRQSQMMRDARNRILQSQLSAVFPAGPPAAAMQRLSAAAGPLSQYNPLLHPIPPMSPSRVLHVSGTKANVASSSSSPFAPSNSAVDAIAGAQVLWQNGPPGLAMDKKSLMMQSPLPTRVPSVASPPPFHREIPVPVTEEDARNAELARLRELFVKEMEEFERAKRLIATSGEHRKEFLSTLFRSDAGATATSAVSAASAATGLKATDSVLLAQAAMDGEQFERVSRLLEEEMEKSGWFDKRLTDDFRSDQTVLAIGLSRPSAELRQVAVTGKLKPSPSTRHAPRQLSPMHSGANHRILMHKR